MTDSLNVVNMVASTRLTDSLDINSVAELLDIDYEQEQFPGMVYRTTDPKVCVLLFRSGKAVATGAKSMNDVNIAFDRLYNDLDKNGFALWESTHREVILQNVVITHDVGRELHLTNLSLMLPMACTEYEPEQFPGLIFRLSEPKAVCLIFSSGRCVITGCTTLEMAKEAADNLTATINELLDA
jgi:transcription initiation factor TFIID TATA-box-binding protein